MKKLLISVLGLLVVLTAAVLVAPSFVDWNAQKSRLTALVENSTGRKLSIDGEMKLAILPAPALSANTVRFQNIEGGSEPSMIEFDALRVRVALLPLLQGRIQFESISMVRPRILLEVLPDGRRNWEFAETGSEGQEPRVGETAGGNSPDGGSSGSQVFPGGVRFDSFSIEDGTLVYRDMPGGREERLDGLNGMLIADSIRGPFALQGTASVRGLETAFDLNLGRLVEAGATRFKGLFSLPEGAAQAEVSGTVSLHPDTVALRGKLEASGRNFASVAAVAAGAETASFPAFLANGFEASTEFASDLDQLTVNDLQFRLGDTAFEGEASMQLADLPVIRVRLGASKLDLDSLLAGAQDPIEPAEASEQDALESGSEGAAGTGNQRQAAEGARESRALSVPRDLDIELKLSADAVVYRGQVIRQARFEGRLTDGRAAIDKAMALLPGGSDISLSGNLEDPGTGPVFGGHVEAASDNIRAVLEWLGTDLSVVPQDRLRRMAFSGDITADKDQVTLQNLDLKVDVSRVLGGVVVALRERVGMGIGLSIDRIDLDAYLDGSGGNDSAAGNAGTAGGSTANSANEADSDPRGILDRFDANIDFRIGSITYQGTTAKTVRLNGTLQDGALTFKDASVGDLVGNSARYAGSLTGLGQSPTLEGSLELRIANPTRLGRLLPVDQSALETVGPFNLNGNVKASLAEIAFNARVAALDGQFALDGTVQPLAAPLAFDLVVDADHENLATLVNRLSGKRLLGKGLGGLDAKARLTGTPASIRISDLSGRVGPSALRGSLVAGLSGGSVAVDSVDLAIAARHGNLAALTAALGLGSPVSAALGGIDLSAKLSGSPSDLRVSDLKGRVGPIDLTGSLAANLGPASPALSAVDLQVGVKHANLAQLLGTLSVASPVSPALGGVDLTGKVSGSQNDLRLSNLNGRIGPLSLSGSLSANVGGPTPVIGSVDLGFDVRHPNLAQLTSALGRPGTVSPSFGGIDLRGRVVGTPAQIELKGLDGKIGPGDVRGTVAADLRGAKPDVKIDLVTGPLPVAALLATSGATGGQSGRGIGGSLSPRWSTRPIDLSVLRSMNADVNLRSAALLYDSYRLDDAVVRAVLRDSQVDIQQFSGTIYNGAVQVAGKITAGNQLDVGLAVNAIEIELGQLVRGRGDLDRVSGPITVNASLSSRGSSEAELVSRLNGEGSLSGTLTIRAKAQEALGAALLGLLGDEVKEIRGLADTTNTLLNAFAGAPAPLKGTFRVANGQVQTRDLRLDGRDAHALTSGAADLPSWQIGTRTDVYRRGDTQDPYITAHMTGPLDSPNPRVEGGLFKRRPPPQQAPAQQAPGNDDQAPRSIDDLKDLKPKDLLKDLLKGLGQ